MEFLSILIVVFVAAIVIFLLFHIFGFFLSLAVPVLIIAGIIWLFNKSKRNGETIKNSNVYDNTQTSNGPRRRSARNASTSDVKDDDSDKWNS